MRTGYLYSWTALLAVGIASAQTSGTQSAPGGSSAAGGQGAPAASSGAAGSGSAATPSASAPLEGAWDDGTGQGA
jgi:hypothetical protein